MKILITEKQFNLLFEQKVTVDSIADGLWASIKGPGTSEENFYKFLSLIKDTNTFNLVNKKLKEKYKEDFHKIVNDSVLTVAEFTNEEKKKIVNILNTNKIPHVIDDKGFVILKSSLVNFLDPATLNPSNKLLNFLMFEEGDPKQKGEPVLKSYKKPGDVWTIGYGHTTGVKPKMKINKDKAIKFLKQDANVAADCVKRIFNEWKSKKIDVKITQSMFDVLVSLAFNAGCGNLRGDSSNTDVIDFVRVKKFATAAQKIKTFKLKKGFSGLIDRREKESIMFCEQGGCGEKGATKNF